nr:monocarboxylate transporter 3-like [Dermacentor andersoni]XP_054928362.1 monocarboxylate transporter 3-like [Dermacentor andersoni]XP_054928363.1 monocarboxylate transporter 3-like [Dermacentor andersoni]
MALALDSLKSDPSFGLDSRRSWVTAVFLSISLTMVKTAQHSVGVLFYGIVHTYGVRRQEASWPLVLTNSLAFLAGPVMGYLCGRCSCQLVLLVSTLIAGASVCACFFADSIFALNILFGIVHGTAVCGVHVAVTVIVSQHFEKRRATACSVIYTAMCINSAYLPPLTELLRVNYGVRGTFLLIGGMVLNGFPPVLAVQSPEWTKPKQRSLSETVHSPVKDNEKIPNNHLLPAGDTRNGCVPGDAEIPNGTAHQTMFAEVSLRQNDDSGLKTVPLLSSDEKSVDKDNAAKSSFSLIVRQFASVPFAVSAISFAVIALGMSTFMLLSVDIAVDRGIPSSSGVFLLNAFAVTDIVARPLSGLIIDSGFLSLESVMLIGFILQFLALELFVWLEHFPLMLASSALFGVSNGLRITLLAPFIVKEFGMDQMAHLFGGVSFCSGLVLLTRPFLVGYWRDHLGSYDGLLHFVAIVNAVVAVMWMAKLYVRRRQQRLI